NDELWADYTRKLAKVQSETELSRKINREELKSWYNNNKFKFIPNEIDFNSFDISGNIEIPYFPVAMYMVVESNDSTESYAIGDIKKYITPTSDTNLDLDYLKSKVTEMKNHLDTSHYNHVFPIGSIVFFITDNNLTGIIKDEGNTFIKCDGQECNGEEYPELLSKIGNKDNSIEFNVPNLMDKVIVIGDDITGGSNTENVSGKIESIKYDILKQTSYDKNNETSKNKSKVFTRFNEELSKRGPIATGATTDDRKTYGLITGPTSIWYKSSKLGTETKPINMKGLNQILTKATVEFDKKMINHLYVIPYIVAAEDD
ncbi:MAG: tail fiber protein, partial [Clostridia bacterium]|nr:tail fiber protein [Clostridia bacterium]